MDALQLPLGTQPHRNQQLFSDHYLNVILPQRSDWQSLTSQSRTAMEQIAAIFASFVPSDIEAQTEETLVRPVLRHLGHTFEVQPSLKTPDGTKTPDYILYRDQEGIAANKNRILTEELLRPLAFGVGEAKHWDRPLDVTMKVSSGDPFNNRNPAYQIAFYMQHTGLPWGILTNGRLWRLYNQYSAHKLDRYYEVDLPALLAKGDPASFLYFYGFFRRAAFDLGAVSVDAILRSSTDYARGVGDSLKSQVFTALRHIAQGFLDYPPNRLQPDETTLTEIYDNSLILLYRLLFVLYAEARELLPVRENRTYREVYSLRALTHAMAHELDHDIPLLPGTSTRWPALKSLFDIIDAGNDQLGVPIFNGGLFDAGRHPFLERYAVGDAHLRQAIDTLARVHSEFVDYRDLAEQHLGTIYEGLLEYHLAAIPAEDGWTIAIVNEEGQRKTTGSYYTPNFIVKYIVDQTVGPLVRSAISDLADDDAKIEAILNLNIVDPAMGSAYFLVEATEYIARFLVDQALIPTDATGEPDLVYWKRRVAQSCIYGVDLNPLAVDLAKLSLWLATVAKGQPLSFLDHHLRAGNSLIGARIADFTVDPAPTPKRKSRAAKIAREEAAGQLSMLDDDAFRKSIGSAVGSMDRIEHVPGLTIDDIKEQERIYAEMRATFFRQYGRLADLVTASKLGLEIDPALWVTLRDFATGRILAVPAKLEQWMEQAGELAESFRFFYWDLEFPEVFFAQDGRSLGEHAGFDAVVGNPPYVRQERLKPSKPYLRANYDSFQSTADLYIYFYERGLSLLHERGRLGFITSGTFTHANFAKAFRQFLPAAAQIESVIDFGENQPFEGAEMVRPTIMVTTKGGLEQGFRSLLIEDKVPSSLETALSSEGVEVDPVVLQQPAWSFRDRAVSSLFVKIRSNSTNLANAVEQQMYYGIKTGLNEAFIVESSVWRQWLQSDNSIVSFLKPLVVGQDLRPWYQESEGRRVIVFPSGWTAKAFGKDLSEYEAWCRLSQKFPQLASHLEQYASDARKRTDKGDYWWELRPCDYYEEFGRPKILWPDISKLPRFSFDVSGMYTNDTSFFLPIEDHSLLGILQSRVLWFAVSQICQRLRLRGGLWQYRLKRQYINHLPIPKMNECDREIIDGLARKISFSAKERYTLDERTRKRIRSDLDSDSFGLNRRLFAWWELDGRSFRYEVQKQFRRDIPLRERDEWEAWLAGQITEHQRLTEEIVRLETDLNRRVYNLFDLTASEIAAIEEITKYPYGEV